MTAEAQVSLSRLAVDKAIASWRGNVSEETMLADLRSLFNEAQHDLHSEIRKAMNELGVPQGNYPASISNAYRILAAIVNGPAEAEVTVDGPTTAALPAGLADRAAIYQQLRARDLGLEEIEFIASERGAWLA